MERSPIRWWQRIIQRLAMTRVVSSLFLARYLHRMDTAVLGWSEGRRSLTTMLSGLPVVVLISTGARSGKTRSTPLAGFPDGEKVILIPSSFGSPRFPDWYHNLQADPHVQLIMNGHSNAYMAHISDQRECKSYWQLAVDYYPGYQAYQQRSGGREIPIVVLEPVPNGEPLDSSYTDRDDPDSLGE